MNNDERVEILLFIKSFCDFLLKNYEGQPIIDALDIAIPDFISQYMPDERQRIFIDLLSNLNPETCFYKAIKENCIKSINESSH